LTIVSILVLYSTVGTLAGACVFGGNRLSNFTRMTLQRQIYTVPRRIFRAASLGMELVGFLFINLNLFLPLACLQ
jgi:hypothetical protein